jgi:O-antigen/teichoic acid export membrane protein
MSGLIAGLASHPRLIGLVGRFARSSMTRRFLSGAGWLFLGNAAWKLLAAVANILFARILGPEGIGELGIVRSTASIFEIFAGLRLGVTATRYVAEHRVSDPQRAARILKLALIATTVLCGAASLFLFVGSPWLARYALDNPGLSGLLALGAVMVFVNVYGRVQELALAGFERFRAIASVNVWRGAGNLVLCVPLAYCFGVDGALIGLIAVAGLVMIRYAFVLRQEKVKAGFPRSVPLQGVRAEMPILWHFALPGFVIALLSSGTGWVTRAIIAHQAGGYVQLGLFEAAQQMRFPVAFLPSLLAPVILPLLAQAHGAGASGDFRAAMGLQLRTITFVNLPITIILIGFAAPLALLFGKAFADLPPVIALAAIAAFLYSIDNAISRVFDGVGRRWFNAVFFAIWSAVFIAGAWYWVPASGAFGLALAGLVAEAVMVVLQVLYVDLVLVRGVLRGHARLMAFALVLLGAIYLAATTLPQTAAMVAAALLCVVAAVPVLIVAWRRMR